MWIWFVIAGLFGGVLGGMGMGGGTLLIPILTLFLGVSQHAAQGINLLVFIPLGVVCIIIHAINGLIDFKAFVFLVLPAILSSVWASSLSSGINNGTLKTIFGVFLIAVAVYLLVLAIIKTIKKPRAMLKNRIYIKNVHH